MGSSLLFHENLLKDIFDSAAIATRKSDCSTDVWRDQPNVKGVILYSVITPAICIFGICSNTVSLMVLKRRELSGSVYIYLIVLAAMDLLMSIVILLGGLSRGIFYYEGWAIYDALIGLPLSGVINTWSVMATVGVTIDRVLFLWKPTQCGTPRFCNQNLARKIMIIGCFIAVISNLPYCFIFRWDRKGHLVTSRFFWSRFYTIFNWFMLVIFDLVPAIILIIGNGFLIISLQKTRRLGLKLKGKCRDHTSLTVTLISITLVFLISEIPSSLVSRTKAVTVLFRGDPDKGNTQTLEVFRQICTLLGALNITMNFFLYCLFCPAFSRVLVKMLKRNSRRAKTVQVNLFLVNGQNANRTIAKTEILHIENKDSEFSYPSSLSKLYEDSFCKLEMNSRRTEEAEYVDIIDDPKFSNCEILEKKGNEL